MLLLSALLLLLAPALSAAAEGAGHDAPAAAAASLGCTAPVLPPGQHHRLPLNKTVMRNITLTDRNNLTRNRLYAIHIPSSYNRANPLPLLLNIHGQTGTAKGDIPPYIAIGEREGFITLSGQGMDDGACSTGWNVGATGLTSVCTREAWSSFGANSTCCYDTCRELGRCTDDGKGANCGWSTCFEDLDFFAALLKTVEAELCINTAARFATGGSNGGMMVHRLTAQMPTTFRAVVPIYGLPLAGHLKVPQPLAKVSILQLHDRWDATIPVAGGNGEGFLYTSLNETLRAWVAVGADNVDVLEAPLPPKPIVTQWDGGQQGLACEEYPGAGVHRRVIKCLFDGYHGSWLPDNHGEELTWWFFKQFM